MTQNVSLYAFLGNCIRVWSSYCFCSCPNQKLKTQVSIPAQYCTIQAQFFATRAHRWSPTPTPSHKGGGDDPYPYPYIPHIYICTSPRKIPIGNTFPKPRAGRHRQNVHGSAADHALHKAFHLGLDLCHLSAVHGLSPGHWSICRFSRKRGQWRFKQRHTWDLSPHHFRLLLARMGD